MVPDTNTSTLIVPVTITGCASRVETVCLHCWKGSDMSFSTTSFAPCGAGRAPQSQHSVSLPAECTASRCAGMFPSRRAGSHLCGHTRGRVRCARPAHLGPSRALAAAPRASSATAVGGRRPENIAARAHFFPGGICGAPWHKAEPDGVPHPRTPVAASPRPAPPAPPRMISPTAPREAALTAARLARHQTCTPSRKAGVALRPSGARDSLVASLPQPPARCAPLALPGTAAPRN